jgi:hypothetical protein
MLHLFSLYRIPEFSPLPERKLFDAKKIPLARLNKGDDYQAIRALTS